MKKETSLERARAMQRNFIAWYLKVSRGGKLKDAALVAFVSPDSEDWRFSLVKMEYTFEETPKGKVKVREEFTPAKRWSFLVGKNENCHTAQSRFIQLLENDNWKPTLEDLEEAFNVEIVTKEFFEKYRDLFIKTKIELDKILHKNSIVKTEFESKNINTVDFAKKLLGQIVFLYFLQKKGWFGVEKRNSWGTGPKDFMRMLFNKEYGEYQNFYNDIFEPLFYEALRTDRSADGHYYSRFNCKIPFLNGGLFDPINNFDWVKVDINLPNELFSNTNYTQEGDIGDGILDVFDRYNFTVNEEEPFEKEVALDPELLGKIYEKLNAIRSENFDEFLKVLNSGKKGEEAKFNKEYGVYYTPREIVHYMCQESLINYLETELNGKVSRDDLGKFFKYADSQEIEKVAIEKAEKIERGEQKSTKYESEIPESIKQNAKKIDKLLADIKICDPAVGSGAFPIGMMHEIVRLRQLLSIYTEEDTKSYDLKRNCIENSIYGVDIDPGAVEICKLRFWLSLIVDEEDFYNIKPLPNLDYKVVCGDSLLEVKVNLFNQNSFNKLEQLKPLYFNETNPLKKQKLKKEIDELIYEITEGHKEFDFKVYFSEVFHQKGGFDIVIANPPYVGEKGHKEMFKKYRQVPIGHFYQGKMDLFYFFFHQSLNIASQKAYIAFITTNYYPTASGGRKLREDFKKRAIIKKQINFNELKIFESALGQHNMITILQKGQDQNAIAQTYITQRQGFATTEILNSILNKQDIETQYYQVRQKDLYDGDEYYIRLSGIASADPIQKILDKIKSQGVNLKSICNIKQGIVTGADKVTKKHIEKYKFKAKCGEGIFVLSKEEINTLKLNELERSISRPWFKNSDIKKWTVKTSTDQFVLYLNGKYNEKQIPNIIKHLSKFKLNLQERREVHKGSRNWYDLWRPRKENIFNGEKLVVPQRSYRNTFGYSNNPWYASADVYFITQNDKKISLKYILAILNSKLFYLWFYYRGKKKGEMLELYQTPLSETPIKRIIEKDQECFILLVDQILTLTQSLDYLSNPQKQAKVKEFERQIDQIVYKLYDLTEDEIKIIEKI
ncbi:MAG: TaqI-like C-terminal specificity domain-containing protein [candidate division WOR-3 bacterium]